MPRLDDIRGLEWQGSTAGPLPVIAPLIVGVGAPTNMLMTPRPMYTLADGNGTPVGNLLSVGATGPIAYSVSSQSTPGALRVDADNYTVSQNQAAPAGPYTIVIRGTNITTNGYMEKQFAFTCVTGDGLWLTNNYMINNGSVSYAGSNLFGKKYNNRSDIAMTETSGYFTFDNGYTYYEPNAKGVYPPPGDYPLQFKSAVGGLGYDNTFITTVVQSAASTAIQFFPRTVSSVAKIGQIVGILAAFNQNNSYTWTVINSDNGFFNVVGNADGTANVTVAKDNPAQGAHTIRAQVVNGSNSYQQDISLSVVFGTEYPSTNISMAVLGGLTNYTAPNTVIGTPAMTGMSGTISWRVVQNYGGSRWACAPITGTITNAYLMSAYPEDITLVASNGIDVCLRTFTISATETTAWVDYHCGPGQPYATISDASGAAYGGGKPCKIMIHASTDTNYYMGDNAAYGAHMLVGSGGLYPICYIGVVDAVTGELPIVGGGGGYFSNGFFTCSYSNQRDTRIENLEITRCYYYDQNASTHLDGIVFAFGGMLTIRNCHVRNNDMGLLADVPNGSVFVYDSIFSRAGDAEVDRTHNIYVNAYRFHMERVTSYGCQIGHNVKSRSVITSFIDCDFMDGEMGRSSTSVNCPNGTDGYFLRCYFQKGAGTEQANIIRYGEEGNHDNALRPVQRMVFDDCDFVNHQPAVDYEPFNNVVAVMMSNLQLNLPDAPVLSPTTGLAATASFTNCRMFNVPTGRVLDLGGVYTDPPSGITYVTESPPLRFQSRLLNGAKGRAITPWLSPRHGPPAGYFDDGQRWKGDSGMLDVGVHEIRMLPSAAAGAVIARMKMWRSQAGVGAFGPGATWSLLTWTRYGGGTFLDYNFQIIAEADGTARLEQTTQHAAGVYWVWPRATSPDGVILADQPIYIVCSTVGTPANEIPAALISYP